MSTFVNKLSGVLFSAAILGGAVALADGAPALGQAATTLVAGSEGAMVVALVNSNDGAAPAVQPVQVAAAQTTYAGQAALLRAPAAPRSH